jgi:hypothetical protein
MDRTRITLDPPIPLLLGLIAFFLFVNACVTATKDDSVYCDTQGIEWQLQEIKRTLARRL